MAVIAATRPLPRLGADFTKNQAKWLKPDEVVEKSFRSLDEAQVVCIPGFKRRLIVKFADALPRLIYYRLMKAISLRTKKFWDEIEKALI